MATVKHMPWGTIVESTRDGHGRLFKARVSVSTRAEERGRVHVGIIATDADGSDRYPAEVFGTLSPDDCVAFAEQLLRYAARARKR